MADVVVAVTLIDADGASEAFVAMATGNTYKVRNNGRTLIHLKKSGAGDANVTIQTPKQVAGLAVADPIAIVPATVGDVMVAPVNKDLFNDAVGDVNLTTDEGTGLTIAAVRL